MKKIIPLLTLVLLFGCKGVKLYHKAETSPVDYPIIIRNAAYNRSRSVRYLCKKFLVDNFNKASIWLLIALEGEDQKRRDVAATVIFEARKKDLYKNIAEYFVSRLEDDQYYYFGRDEGDWHRHRHLLPYRENDRKYEYLVRCPYYVILEIGEPAIPHLTRLVNKSQNRGAKANAFHLLREIYKKHSLTPTVQSQKRELKKKIIGKSSPVKKAPDLKTAKPLTLPNNKSESETKNPLLSPGINKKLPAN